MTRACELLVVLLAFASAGCAARTLSPQTLASLARADALVREGCYRCLDEALAMYEKAAAARRAPAGALRGAFDASLLLAVRAKELGLPSEALLERARLFAARLAPTEGAAVQPPELVRAAELLAGDVSGFDPEERLRRARSSGPVQLREYSGRRALEAAADGSLVAAYLALSIDCERMPRPEIDVARVLARHGGPPLMLYRLAICGLGKVPIATLREANPQWVETLFFEGRREVESRAGDAAKAVALLTMAHDAFPASHAILLALARAQQAVGEYAMALSSVDRVIASVPEHRDALLGRVENLSYLNRHEEAIAAASRLIELGAWHLGDAYYWRAWNEHSLKQLDAAWADVEEALKLQTNSSVYTLAGFIAHARKDLDVAVDRFERAFELDPANCLAAFSGAMVHVEQQAWRPASTKFSRGMSCYTADAAFARGEMARIEASSYAPDRKARLLAAQQKRLTSSEHLAAQSAFNAAQCYYRLADKGPALEHVDAAAAHPLMRDKASSLKTLIEKMR